ncbi:hypothetical protein HMPREF0294_0576 [Corynebacterium glucuronolyticum ATCC 51867]|nr:hypothetical protein HMPREF0294_0576 [Corynebacterium glucuronolyticum ATCC 51867]
MIKSLADGQLGSSPQVRGRWRDLQTLRGRGRLIPAGAGQIYLYFI